MVRFEKSGILFVLSVIILFPVEQNSSAFQPPEEEVDPTFRRGDPLSETLFTGYTRLYVPVVVSAPGHASGEIVRVRLGAYDGERVRAALV